MGIKGCERNGSQDQLGFCGGYGHVFQTDWVLLIVHKEVLIKWRLALELGPEEQREDRILVVEDLGVTSLTLPAKLLRIFETYLALFIVELGYKKFPKYAFMEEWL